MEMNDAELEQFVQVFYPYRLEKNKIRLVIDNTERGVEEIALWANQDGMAYLTGLVADFVLFQNPEGLAYSVGVEQGLLLDSPLLWFEFDASLDNE